MKKSTIIVCILLLAVTLNAKDQETYLEEFFQSEVIYPQEEGELQITLTPTFSKGEDKLYEIPITVEYGITDAFQIEVEWVTFAYLNPEEGSSVEGIGDLELGVKYSFVDILPNFHFAVAFEVSIPTGSVNKDLSEGAMEYEPSLIFALDIPGISGIDNLHLFVESGIGFIDTIREEDDEDEDDAHEFFLNTGFFLAVEQFRITMELNWETNEWNNDGDEKELFFTPGVVWDLPGDWQVGLGFPIGFTSDADDYAVILSLTYEFNIFGEEDEDEEDEDEEDEMSSSS